MPSKLSDYDVISVIGSGSYGKCEKIRRKSDGKVLVWKDMDYGSMTEMEKQQLVSEVNLLRQLKHHFIVRYYDRVIDRSRSRLYLIMEFCAGGDLASLISKCRKQMTYMDEDFIVKILVQLCLALQACHGERKKSFNEEKILHRDLKPANVFLDENQDVKLGDFGLARVLHHETSFAKTFVGTPYYMSPEQVNKNLYNEKSDIWSLGCLLYEMCSLVPPFTAPNQRLLTEKIKLGQFRRIPSRYSELLQSCISSMLRLTANDRPSLNEILELPLLKESVKKYKQLAAQSNTEIDVNLKNQKSSESDEAKSTTIFALLEKEKQLEKRLQNIEQREENVKRKEKALEEREREVEVKMKTAESLIRQYKDKVMGKLTNYTSETKKQVHFADAKENDCERYNNKAYIGSKLYNGRRMPLIHVSSKPNRVMGMR